MEVWWPVAASNKVLGAASVHDRVEWPLAGEARLFEVSRQLGTIFDNLVVARVASCILNKNRVDRATKRLILNFVLQGS
jgi:hypothetical protein